MDTISNLASSASKLIYGDQQQQQHDQDPQQQSGQEPVSGQSGTGTATDPYDSGNLHDDPEKAGKPAQQTNLSPTLNATADDAPSAEPVVGANLVDRTKDKIGADKIFDAEGGDLAAAPTEGSAQGVNVAGDFHPEHGTEKTGVTSLDTSSSEPHGVDIRSSERDAATDNSVGAFGAAVPSVGADPTSQPVQKQKGGDRPDEEPSEDQANAIKEKMNDGEAALAKRDPNDQSGEPLNVVNEDQDYKQNALGPGGPEEDLEKGAGEQYVKSTGFNADGGDFDAAKPGAGKEADRLLESKGVPKEAGAAMYDSNAASSSPARSQEGSEHGGKTSMKTKIKEKLHIGKHKE